MKTIIEQNLRPPCRAQPDRPVPPRVAPCSALTCVVGRIQGVAGGAEQLQGAVKREGKGKVSTADVQSAV